jgi:DNA-binding HxlR family transcriptional regulator
MSRRSYDQFCGLAVALDVVGERWTLLLVRDLALGPQRYSDLLAGLPGMGTNLLADRLRRLEADDVVRRTTLPPPAATTVYELTDSGRELAEALLPLAVWGARRLDYTKPAGRHRADWLLLALRANFRTEAAVGVQDTYEFRIDGAAFHVRVRDGQIDVRRGPAPDGADAVIETDLPTLMELGVGRLTAAQAVKRKRARIDADPDALARCAAILGPGQSRAQSTARMDTKLTISPG